jgi:hypothetical protein
MSYQGEFVKVDGFTGLLVGGFADNLRPLTRLFRCVYHVIKVE